MIPTEKPLDNPINWSFKVGRLWDIDVRVHIAFVIAAVILVWMELPKEGASSVPLGQVLTDALGIYAILFLIVLLHELGHCYGARRSGGEANEILLWPLGGLAYVSPPHEARAHLLTAVAGPMVNVIICGICAGVIVLWFGQIWAVPWNPMHPMWPADPNIIPTTPQLWLIRVFGISYFLLLINMLPIYPFDGGRVLQALLWPSKGYAASLAIATSTGMIGAIVIGLFGLFTEQGWLLMMIAVFGYLTCWQTRRMAKEQAEFGAGEFGYDFGGGYTSLEQSEKRPGFFARRRSRREEAKAQRLRLQREKQRTEVESVLRKVSSSGLDSLTPDERRVLEAETTRKRGAPSE